ncbi:YybH family protein [Flavobacterium sedimenticola]|uniref:Nuclear transport factor 2 family protein n=1 Tax=Flavobacterium sedimenticola TaxID=3043286 RepID=A0ABT6XP97_9FLAO|nr:DUF4440 domain-containing protein [Flavobacterium sedimenticola]MDI9256917.1 nuclear transport factor 2 family protein [Flavobacterium sedimenticola]
MKKTFFLSAVMVGLILVTASCKKPKVTSGFDDSAKQETELTEAKNEIVAAAETFVIALNKGDSIGLANCYTSDAKLMQPNGKSIVGRENIQKLFSGWIKAGIPRFSMKTIGVWGDKEVMVAEEEWIFSDAQGKILDSGKSLEMYKKEDGKWKLFRDCYNSDLPLTK